MHRKLDITILPVSFKKDVQVLSFRPEHGAVTKLVIRNEKNHWLVAFVFFWEGKNTGFLFQLYVRSSAGIWIKLLVSTIR